MTEITGLTSGGASVSLIVSHEGKTLRINKLDLFDRWVTDPLKTTENRTVGEMNRANLHKWLDNFIDTGDIDG